MARQQLIGEATLVKMENGVQTYQYANGEKELIWGWNSASNVRVGDRGVMIYESTPSYGLPFFRKGKTLDNYPNVERGISFKG